MKRRMYLAGSATLLAASPLAGCLNRLEPGGDDVPEPVDLLGDKFDDDHGMEIGPHGGANAQIFYGDATPPDRESGPFWFHTLVFSGFPFYFDRRSRGWDVDVFYATDYSATDWTIQKRDGGPTMPSPTAKETFADATTLTYVAESDVRGGMGAGLHPFSNEDDASTFVDDYGGELLEFDDITPTLVENLQGQ